MTQQAVDKVLQQIANLQKVVNPSELDPKLGEAVGMTRQNWPRRWQARRTRERLVRPRADRVGASSGGNVTVPPERLSPPMARIPSKKQFLWQTQTTGCEEDRSSCVTRPAEITSKSESTPGHHESIDPERIHACRSGWSQHTGNPAAWRVWSYPARRARQVSDHRDTASLVQTLPAPPRSAG